MEETRGVGKVPPHSDEAERAVLGSLMIDPVRVAEVAERLVADDFFSRRHALIYQALVDLAESGEPVDFVSVGERLLAGQNIQQAGGRAYLIELASSVTSSAHLNHHAKIVAETALLRRLIAEASRMIEEAYETRPHGTVVQELVDRCEHAIFHVSEEKRVGEADPISRALAETFQRIDSSSHRGDMTGLPSGFSDLDELTGGFNGGDLVILAARPSMGKTALALNMIEHAALKPPSHLDRPPVILFFSLEMGRVSIGYRMLCSRAQVDAHKLRTGKIPREEYQELSRAAGELDDTRIFIDDSPGLTVMSLRSRARRLRLKQGALDMVLVDYLQLMSHPRSESRQIEISQISRSLKELARELEIPVVALSQLSRAVESREDKRPLLSDLRESGSIEQDADVVLLLFRPEYYKTTDENQGLAELICAKHRNGPTGTVRLTYRANYMRFENRAHSFAVPLEQLGS